MTTTREASAEYASRAERLLVEAASWQDRADQTWDRVQQVPYADPDYSYLAGQARAFHELADLATMHARQARTIADSLAAMPA